MPASEDSLITMLFRFFLIFLLSLSLVSRPVASFRPRQSVGLAAEKDIKSESFWNQASSTRKDVSTSKLGTSTALALNVRGGGVVGFLVQNPLVILRKFESLSLQCF